MSEDTTPQPQGGNTPESSLDRLISRNGGDSNAVAMLLFSENREYRQTIRDLKKRLPADGSIVLSPEDAKRWEALRAHDPDELAAALQERESLQQELSDYKRKAVISNAAKLAGYDADVLQDLPNLPQIEVIEKDGVQVAEVVNGDARVELSAYVQQHYAKFLPALQPPEQQRAQPVRIPQQSGTSKPVAFSLDDFIKQRNEAANAVPSPLASSK